MFVALEFGKEVEINTTPKLEKKEKQEKALIVDQKEQNQYVSTNVFKLNIEFECERKQDD